MIEKYVDKFRQSMREFIFRGVSIEDYHKKTYKNLSGLGYEQEEGKVWYEGDIYKLQDFYNYYCGTSNDAKQEYFWAKTPNNTEIRKIHSGIPNMMVKKLTEVTLGQGYDYEVEEQNELTNRLMEILESEANTFEEVANKACNDTQAVGDGAFKITIDQEKFDVPVIEWEDGRFVDYVYDRNKLMEIVFKTEYLKKGKDRYVLLEKYGRGYIDYELYRVKNDDMKEVSLTAIPETISLPQKDEETGHSVVFDTNNILAVPLKFFMHPEHKHRGASIFRTKTSMLDSLDEGLSIGSDALRDGRVQTYIPSNKIPRSRTTGKLLLNANRFNKRFVVTEADKTEGAKNEIKTVQPNINYDIFENSYKDHLDRILLGVLSPSSLGLNIGKRDNAEAQREKEKTTLNTRNGMIRSLKATFEQLFNLLLEADAMMSNRNYEEQSIRITFNQYAAPSMESKIKSLAEAKFKGIMSNEMIVNQLWGDRITEEERENEIERLNKADGGTELDMSNILPSE